jgi:F0F1-type ATP synthase membrane subunit b/b'
VGQGENQPTTMDNEPAYTLPIGKLPDSVRERLNEWRIDALALRSRADTLRHEARGRLGEAREKLDEVRAELRQQMQELKSDVAEAARRLRRKKDD